MKYLFIYVLYKEVDFDLFILFCFKYGSLYKYLYGVFILLNLKE